MKTRSRYLLMMVLAWGPCLLVAAAAYAMFLRPQQEHRKALEVRVAECKEQYAQAVLAAKEKNHDALTRQVETLHSRVRDFVVSPEDAPNLSLQIGEMANEVKLESFGIRPAANRGPEAPAGSEYVAEQRMDMTFSADFRRFAAFLNGLERHRPVLFVEAFTISRPADQKGEPQIGMELAVLMEKPAAPSIAPQ